MIIRIKIDGFKSLLQTDLYFSPFTCIAGENAVGKSNFFDALIFLSNLTDNTIQYSAKSIRSEDQKHSNVRDIFFRNGDEYLNRMNFEIDMIVPQKAEDDLGQMAIATITTLRYNLELKLNDEYDGRELIEIVREELIPISQNEAKKSIFFDYSKKWLSSVILGRRSGAPFISTKDGMIKLHSDSSEKKRGGRTTEYIAEKMPRTLLSTVTAESPTAFLARKEMRNWIMLQFEPSALRRPNFIYEVKNAEIKANGLNLPATLYRLQQDHKEKDTYTVITNRLKGLVEDVKEIKVDKDEKRDLLTLQIGFKGGLYLPAQSLSDGTLRFLGLAVIQEDSISSGLICLEEPENGINPRKVDQMVELLQNIATDINYPVDEDNPLRQVIVNTHSPIVVSSVPDESLYLAKGREFYNDFLKRKIKGTGFSALKHTWKTENKLINETSLGEIIDYLDRRSLNDNIVNESSEQESSKAKWISKGKKTVTQNIQLNLDFDL